MDPDFSGLRGYGFRRLTRQGVRAALAGAARSLWLGAGYAQAVVRVAGALFPMPSLSGCMLDSARCASAGALTANMATSTAAEPSFVNTSSPLGGYSRNLAIKSTIYRNLSEGR